MTYRVEVRSFGGANWLPWWNCAPSAEAALAEMRRCSLGFDVRVLDDQGCQLAAIISGGRVRADRLAGVPEARTSTERLD